MRANGDDGGGGATRVVLRERGEDSERAVGRAEEGDAGGRREEGIAQRCRRRGRRVRAFCGGGPQDVGFVELDGGARRFAGWRGWGEDAEEAVGTGGSVAAEAFHEIRSVGGDLGEREERWQAVRDEN